MTASIKKNVLLRDFACELDRVHIIVLWMQIHAEVLWSLTGVDVVCFVRDREVADCCAADAFLKTEPLLGVGVIAVAQLEHTSAVDAEILEKNGGDALSGCSFVCSRDICGDATPVFDWGAHAPITVSREALGEVLVVARLEIKLERFLRSVRRRESRQKLSAIGTRCDREVSSSGVIVGLDLKFLWFL